MNLRDRIRELANRNGMSLPNLESELGFGNGTIVRWDKASPTTEKLQKVADYFGVSIDYLLGGRNENDILIKQLFGWLGTLGDYVKKCREEKNLSQEELSKKSGVSGEKIKSIENNYEDIVSLNILKLLALPLDIDYRNFIVVAGHVTELDNFQSKATMTYDNESVIVNFRTSISLLDYKEGENKPFSTLKNNFVTFDSDHIYECEKPLTKDEEAAVKAFLETYRKMKKDKKD